MKITHYSNPNRDLNGTFTKKKMRTGLKLLLADGITILTMGVLISLSLTGKLYPTQALQSPTSPVQRSLVPNTTIALSDAKQQVLQSQIDQLNAQLEKERLNSLSLK